MPTASVALNATINASLHPFYPLEANIIGYLANDLSLAELLGWFAAGWAGIMAGTWWLARRTRPSLGAADMATILWFVLSGAIHLFFEGYFAFNHTRMPGQQDFFGQLWKEYSLSDSRYLTSDPFVLCMEAITAILWGPLSFMVAGLIVADHPMRFPLQAVVSLGQLYGDVLYYATSMFDLYFRGLTYCRPEPYYFWCYYFAMNLIWIVIPSVLLYQSIDVSVRAFKALEKMSRTLQANGAAKKSI